MAKSGVFHNGLFHTYDGALYHYHRPGEHVLSSFSVFTAVTIDIYVLLVISSDKYNSITTQGCGFKIFGTNSIQILTTTSGNHVVWYNGEIQEVGDKLKISNDVDLIRIAYNNYKLRIADQLVVDVFLFEAWMNVMIKVNPILCASAVGLLGQCNNRTNDDFKLTSGLVLTPEIGGTLSQDSIHNRFGPSWLVPAVNSIFSSLQNVPNGGGRGLSISGSYLISPALYTFSESQVTIEIKFKLSQSSGRCQTVWSYKNANVLSILVCNGQISIHYTNERRDLPAVRISLNVWYHLAVTWLSQTRTLNVYTFTQRLTASSQFTIFEIDKPNPFKPGGTIMIGQWNYLESSKVGVGWNLYGNVDDLRIWRKVLSISEIQANAFSHVEEKVNKLSNHWKFNDVSNVHIDIIAGLNFQEFSSPWPYPQSVMMDYAMSSSLLNAYQLYNFPISNTSEISQACYKFIFSTQFNTICSSLGAVTIEFFRQQCIFSAVVSGNVQNAMEVVLSLSDLCEDRHLMRWPARELCHSFPIRRFPLWTGENCNVRCESGLYTNGSCLCHRGFWGPECDKLCPHVNGKSCGEGRTCNMKTGDCKCSENFAQGCNQCMPGWLGKDCSSAIIDNSVTTNAVCSVSGESHYIMFDGQTFTLEKAGEFQLLQTATFSIYVRQLNCGMLTFCIKEVWIQINSESLTIQSPLDNEETFILWYNKKKIQIETSLEIFGHTVRIENQKLLTVTFGTNQIRISFWERLFQLTVKLDKVLCSVSNSLGLAGNCDGNVDNDFVVGLGKFVKQSEITKEIIHSTFSKYWEVKQGLEKGFIYSHGSLQEPVGIYGHGFSMLFNGSGCYSSLLSNLFSNSGSGTIQFNFKSESRTGVIIAFQSTTSLTVYLNNTVRIQWGSLHIDSNLQVILKKWYQFSLTYDASLRTVTIYILLDHEVAWWTTTTASEAVLKQTGILRIAEWKDNAPLKLSSFYGQVNEIKTWNYPHPVYKLLFSASYKLSKEFSTLTAYWNFNEGFGYVAVDVISKHKIILPPYNAYWWVSDLDLLDVSKDVLEVDPKLKESALKFCREIIMNSPIQKTCSNFGITANSFYYLSCVSDVSVFNELAAVAILQQYAEFCDAVEQPTNPSLTTLCMDTNYTKSLNDSLFDALCLDLCKFGYFDKNRICVCNYGYWDMDCSNICPGGLESPCGGDGLCDQISGKCLCPPTMDPDKNCTSCLVGWTGTNCSVMIPEIVTPTTQATSTTETSEYFTQPTEATTNYYSDKTTTPPTDYTKHACMLFGQGHIYTFSKASFEFPYAGEFRVLKSNASDQHPAIHIRTTHCYNSSICISAVAIRYDSDLFVVRSGYSSESHFIIWKNDVRQDFNDTASIILNKIKLKRISKSKITIQNTKGRFFKVIIRSLLKKLSVTVQLETLFCENSQMLCGSCGDDQVQIYKDSWRVTPENTLFNCMFLDSALNETVNVSTAGYSVFLDKSEITNDFMENIIMPNIDFTIELAVKPSDAKGVILSYRTLVGFDLFIDVTFKIMVNGSIFDTGITAVLEEWHQITIVWQNVNHQIVFYSYCENGAFLFMSFTVSQNFNFENYGYFGLGHPLYPFVRQSSNKAEHQYFVGEIDEVRVWHKALLYVDVVQQRLIRIQTYTNLLVCYWKFDEGEGNIIKDLVSHYDFKIVNYGTLRNNVIWRFSGLPLQPPHLPYFNSFPNIEKQIYAERKCKEIVNNIVFQPCIEAIGRGYLNLFYVACVDDAAGSLNIEASVSISVDMSDYCQEVETLTSWPAQNLCQEFEVFPDWVGPNCNIPCKYPQTFALSLKSSCFCQPGFWGQSCDATCPGGLMNPCSGHGICNTFTGACRCFSNWKGINCDQCANNWYGEDCSVAVQTTTKNTPRICTLAGNGLLSALDGASLKLQEYGTFEFFKTVKDVNIQVITQACDEVKPCILNVGMQFQNSKTLTVSALNGGTLKLDGKVLDSFYQLHISEKYVITREDKYTLEITGPNELVVQIFIQDGYINLFVSIKQSGCASNSGLCGFCQDQLLFCKSTDLDCLIKKYGLAKVIINKNIPSSIILKYLRRFLVDDINNIILPFNPKGKITTGFGIAINGGFVSSPVLTAQQLSFEYITLQLRTRIHSCKGEENACVVLSYSNQDTFAIIIIDKNFYVQFGTNLYKTSITVQVSIWIQISIIYQRTTGHLILHYLSREQSVNAYLIISKQVFNVGGSLVIGQWQESLSGIGIPPGGTFVGDVDRILVWNRRLTYSEIILYWQSPLHNPITGLTMGWNFNAGKGLISNDMVSKHAIIISAVGTYWIESDFYQEGRTDIVSLNIKYPVEVSESITLFCSKITTGTKLANDCKSLSSFSTFYHAFCVINIASTMSQNTEISLDVIISFSSLCQVYEGLTDFPARQLCNSFENFPILKGSDCSIQCVFGTVSSDKCLCDMGYWGSTCTNECPGGYQSPCNQHGTCDEATGICLCQAQWNGNSECGTCATGYTGTDCNIMEPVISPDDTNFHGCYINHKSEFWNFTNVGHGLSNREPGIYRFIHMGDIQIEVRFH